MALKSFSESCLMMFFNFAMLYLLAGKIYKNYPGMQ